MTEPIGSVLEFQFIITVARSMAANRQAFFLEEDLRGLYFDLWAAEVKTAPSTDVV